jgi:hypothetical protein
MLSGGKKHFSLIVKKGPVCYNLFANFSVYMVLFTSAHPLNNLLACDATQQHYMHTNSFCLQ